MSSYFVNGYGQLSLMIYPPDHPPVLFRVDGVDEETLEFVLYVVE